MTYIRKRSSLAAIKRVDATCFAIYADTCNSIYKRELPVIVTSQMLSRIRKEISFEAQK
ncbi:MAG: hypothetical protein IJV33_03430 [Bacteroidaceae bacterium]|nr:hypothetical protein [Bacteroidaceae bacterium]